MSSSPIDRMAARQVKYLLRSGDYSDLGGYPLFALMADGSCLCPECVRNDWKLILRSTLFPDGPRDQWACNGVDVNWESYMECDDCGKVITSAYEVAE